MPRSTRPRTAPSPTRYSAPTRPACCGRPRRRPAPITTAPRRRGALHRSPARTRQPPIQLAAPAPATHSSAEPAEPRGDPQVLAEPPPDAALRVQTPASQQPAPLYRGGTTTTNPVPAAAPRDRGQLRHPDRRQSAVARRDRRSRRWRCSGVVALRGRAPGPGERGPALPLLLLRRCRCRFHFGEPAELLAHLHDQRVRVVKLERSAALVGRGENFHQLVASKIGEIVE